MYRKRSKMSRNWPIPRKGTKYLADASHSNSKGIPLLFLLREVLKIAKTRKEANYMTRNSEILVNNKARKTETFPVQLFDIIKIKKMKKNFKLEIVNKKFTLKEVAEKEADMKIVKIIGKKIISKDKIQMNLEDGQNFLTKEKFSLNDSIVIDTKENKIKKILALKEGAQVEIVSGKHAGETGKIKSIRELSREKIYTIKIKEKEVGLPIKTILVIE